MTNNMMICTGSAQCKNDKCYHFTAHRQFREGVDYCVGDCFDGTKCLPICPIHLDLIHCPSCYFQVKDGCGYKEKIKEGK